MSRPEAEGYFRTRLAYDDKRRVLWQTLVQEVFQPMVAADDTVLELGAGWCDFINHVTARHRIAVDVWTGIATQAAEGVQTHVGSVESLDFIDDATVNLVFASNLLEHLTLAEVDATVAEAHRVLAPGGRLVLVQPNYRLCAERYFDDYTHVSVWSEVGMSSYLSAKGWQLEQVKGRFLPLTVKSRLPVSRTLIRTYLRSPLKPLAGQMLVVARRG